ncbi:MAG: low molecular weight protein arginine phosphatase [bacterium]|nr:low molecular weight protein arginine phosphatase [bacterium]
MKKILFVCSGNTCRSPLAEGIAKKLVAQGDLKDIEVSSSGSSTLDGLPASPLAVSVAEQHSVDLSSHRSRFLTRTVVGEVDLIVTMAEKHRETVGIIEPGTLAYTYLLTDLCGDEDGDVPDPIGMGKEEYENTYRLIERCLGAFVGNIKDFDGWKK